MCELDFGPAAKTSLFPSYREPMIREAEGLLQVTQVISDETCFYSSDADDSQSEVRKIEF